MHYLRSAKVKHLFLNETTNNGQYLRPEHLRGNQVLLRKHTSG